MIMKNKLLGIFTGIGSAAFWGLDTVLIAIVLSSKFLTDFGDNVSLVTTFIHDGVSFLMLVVLIGLTKKHRQFWRVLCSKSGLIIMSAALLGGPIGMGGYILSINALGPSLSSSFSALYPIFGILISFIFLKERIHPRVVIGICVSVFAIVLMGLGSADQTKHLLLGSFFALVCVVGWGSEAVIISAALKEDVPAEIALAIRQMTSVLVYGVFVMPAIKGYAIFRSPFIHSSASVMILFAGIIGTVSYLLYYHTIAIVGASKAMALNISYPAWAFVFQLFVSQHFDIKTFLCVLMIVFGTLLGSQHSTDSLPDK